jgi:small subunit ribosomal protein S20
MANTRSAKKRVRSSARKRQHNRATRSAVKTLVGRARRLSAQPGAGLDATEVRQAVRALDKAAEKGILHRRNAARRKSRLMRALAVAGAPVSSGTAPAQTPRAPGGRRARRA